MKRVLCVVLTLICALAFSGCSGGSAVSVPPAHTPEPTATPEPTPTIALPTPAPVTLTNFKGTTENSDELNKIELAFVLAASQTDSQIRSVEVKFSASETKDNATHTQSNSMLVYDIPVKDGTFEAVLSNGAGKLAGTITADGISGTLTINADVLTFAPGEYTFSATPANDASLDGTSVGVPDIMDNAKIIGQ